MSRVGRREEAPDPIAATEGVPTDRSTGASKGAKETFELFLYVMDRFKSTIQVGGTALKVTGNIRTHAAPPIDVMSANITALIQYYDSERAEHIGELKGVLLQVAIIEIVYGALGLIVLAGLLAFMKCSGRAEKVGWSSIFPDFFGGHNLLHFLAQVVSTITGAIGLVAAYGNDGKNDFGFAVAILGSLSSMLVGASRSKRIQSALTGAWNGGRDFLAGSLGGTVPQVDELMRRRLEEMHRVGAGAMAEESQVIGSQTSRMPLQQGIFGASFAHAAGTAFVPVNEADNLDLGEAADSIDLDTPVHAESALSEAGRAAESFQVGHREHAGEPFPEDRRGPVSI